MSQELEVIDAELETVPSGIFRTDDPLEVIEQATRVANGLRDVVRKQKLITQIRGREHVRVEGWTLLGSMLGVFPFVEWTREVTNETGGGWEARVLARTRDGAVVGSAEAECLRSEATWRTRDDYALRSMAQTRATSKAMRQPLGFVMTLAGFDPTPAEEMPAVAGPEPQSDRPDDDRSGPVTDVASLKAWAEVQGLTEAMLKAEKYAMFPDAKRRALTDREAVRLYEHLAEKQEALPV